MKVGLKYCGGCRAGYDRVSLARDLGRRLDGVVDFVEADSADADMILVVAGCRSACARPTNERHLPVHFITSAAEADRWIARVRETTDKGRNAR
jgi:hypothetical protein